MLLGGAERFDRHFSGSVDFTNGNLAMPTPGAGASTPTTGLVSSALCTVCGWARRTGAGTGGLWVLGGNAVGGVANSFFGLAYNFNAGGNFEIWRDDNTSATLIAGASTLNVWRFYACVSSSAAMVGYTMTTAGVLTTNSAAQSAAVGTNLQFNISNTDEADGNWPGLIAGVRVWNRALSVVELRAEANQLSPVSQRGLVSYMPLRNRGNLISDRYQPGRVWTQAGTFVNGASAPVPEIASPKTYTFYAISHPNAPLFGTDA